MRFTVRGGHIYAISILLVGASASFYGAPLVWVVGYTALAIFTGIAIGREAHEDFE